MKVYYEIISEVTGTVLLRQRKVAKSLRWWLRENGFPFKYEFFIPRGFYFVKSKDIIVTREVLTNSN